MLWLNMACCVSLKIVGFGGGRLEVVDPEVVILEVADSANVGSLLSMGCAVAWRACVQFCCLAWPFCGMLWHGMAWPCYSIA